MARCCDARGPDGRALRTSDDAPAVAARQKEARAAASKPAPAPAAAPAGSDGASAAKGPSKNRIKQQRKLEDAIAAAEEALAAVEEELADPQAWATPYETAKSTARHTGAKRAVEQAYAALEAFEEASPATV